MGYSLGVDLGTTYTAAATWRDGKAEVATLGSRTAAVPSVVLVREGDTVLTGEAADRRAATEPDRVAREFKRRVGDTTPIFLGGSPYSAEMLMSELLEWAVGQVEAREGGAPDRVAVCHPANWGAYKRELLDNAIRQANLGNAIMLTEPEAAAIHYSSTERVEEGDVISVYDLGGGTFDAAVLRKTAGGWETLGTPEGIERLGGIDFDAAVFAHVQRSLGGALEELDEDDPTAMAAVGRLREECSAAKEALSSDTDTSIPVLLPNLQTQVRLNRGEFEDMIRPQVAMTIEALQRALRERAGDRRRREGRAAGRRLVAHPAGRADGDRGARAPRQRRRAPEACRRPRCRARRIGRERATRSRGRRAASQGGRRRRAAWPRVRRSRAVSPRRHRATRRASRPSPREAVARRRSRRRRTPPRVGGRPGTAGRPRHAVATAAVATPTTTALDGG